MNRVLILTAGYGEGHNAAARALAAAVEAEGGTAEVRDFFLETYGRKQQLSQRLYIECINRAPLLWAGAYVLLNRTPLMRALVAPSLYTMQRRLGEDLAARAGQGLLSVVAVYPAYSYLLERLYRGRKAPFHRSTLVTDSITVNRVWHGAGADEWIVPNEATAAVMRAAGVDGGRVLPLGFPVPLHFAGQTEGRAVPGKGAPLRVLYMVNHAPEEAPGLVRMLLQDAAVELTVTVGRNAALGREIERTAPREVEIHGWTQRMPELLMRSHVLIGKAGGAATQEAIAAKTPMLITSVVPGQEEGNARLIVESGCGSVCLTRAAIVDTVTALHADGGALWRKWHEAISGISKPDAAREIARHLLARAK